METEILAFAFAISGLLIGLLAAGIVAAIITAVIWHYFPNCAYTRWINAEVCQEEDLTKYGNAKVGDCLRPRRQNDR